MSIYTLREINEIIFNLQQLIENGASEEDIQIYMDSKEVVEMELVEKLENYAMVITNLQSSSDGKEAEAKRLLENAKSERNAIKRMKEDMQFAMINANQPKIKGEKFNFTVQKNPPSLKVLDDAVIPPQFISVEEVRNIDKKAILAELKNGAEIKGVEIQQGESIRIR